VADERREPADAQRLSGAPRRPRLLRHVLGQALSQIDLVDQVYEGFWMKPAYRVPDNDCACVEPGTTPAATRPIGRFNVRSFITSLADGARLQPGQPVTVRGIAFDGGQGIREVAWSSDGGQTWRGATLGADLGRYSFRDFTFGFTPSAARTTCA
jgi:hypothetical protein